MSSCRAAILFGVAAALFLRLEKLGLSFLYIHVYNRITCEITILDRRPGSTSLCFGAVGVGAPLKAAGNEFGGYDHDKKQCP